MDFNFVGSGNYYRDIIDYPGLFVYDPEYIDYEIDE